MAEDQVTSRNPRNLSEYERPLRDENPDTNPDANMEESGRQQTHRGRPDRADERRLSDRRGERDRRSTE